MDVRSAAVTGGRALQTAGRSRISSRTIDPEGTGRTLRSPPARCRRAVPRIAAGCGRRSRRARPRSTPAYVAAFHGVLLAEGVAVPIPPALSPELIDELIAWTESVPSSRTGPRRDSDPTLDSTLGRDDDAADAYRPRRTRSAPPRLGGTGPPKAVMLSRGNLGRRRRDPPEPLALKSSDRALVTLPSTTRWELGARSHLLAGSCLVFDPAARLAPLEAISRNGSPLSTGARPIVYSSPRFGRRKCRRACASSPSPAAGWPRPSRSPAAKPSLPPTSSSCTASRRHLRLTCLDPIAPALRAPSAGRSRGRDRGGRRRGAGPEAGRVGAIPRAAGDLPRLLAESPRPRRTSWGRVEMDDGPGSVDAFGLLRHEGRVDDVVKSASPGRPGPSLPRRERPRRRPLCGRFVRTARARRGSRCRRRRPRCAEEGLASSRSSIPRDERPAVIEAVESLPTLASGTPDTTALAARAGSTGAGARAERTTETGGDRGSVGHRRRACPPT